MSNYIKLDEIKIRKKDGRIEPFSYTKMHDFLSRLDIKDLLIKELVDSVFEDSPEFMKASDLIKIMERTAARKISPLNPEWEEVAGRLFLARIKNEKFNSVYPELQNIWNGDYTEEELKELQGYLKIERDNLFTYKSANIFVKRYCLEHELPQNAYMRVAMFLMQKELNRLDKVKELYDYLSQHYFTLATPIMVNAGTQKPQMSSCCLMTTDDDTASILDTNRNIGTYSKNLAGIAVDVSAIRSKGSELASSNGFTSGPVPFLKVFEATISAWNQGGTRPGACCIYFPWWVKDVQDLLSLKSNGGIDENRARKLQYGIKINQRLIDAILADEDVVLLSPAEARELEPLFGEEFDNAYNKYMKDPKYPRVRARDLWHKIFKERSETGNIYLFHTENVNNLSMLNRYIGSSNLCTEVVLPSRAAKFI